MSRITGSDLMSKVKFFSGYSRWIDAEGRYESWEEAVQRVVDMHKTKYNKVMSPEVENLLEEAQQAYNNKEILGSQRAFQFGGEQLLRHEARNYNCSASYVDRPAFFQEAMYLLLCGAGVGFSVQRQHIAHLPKLAKRSDTVAKVFVVPDSIEGWADAFGVLLSSYFEDGGTFPEYRGCKVLFDFTKIRPEGAPISGGFKAPGPDGLRQSLHRCEDLLNKALGDEGSVAMRPIVAYDFVMHMADAVLSGGVRRSATICMFSKDDEEMLNAKTGNWFEKNPQRGRSNNSVMLKRDTLTRQEWADIMKSVKSFGEPGFILTDDEDTVYNPCVTGDTPLLTSEGYVPVGTTVGKEVKIWNGNRWSTVTPFSTGVNPLVKVSFSDGSSLRCTPYHKFILADGERVEAKDLKDDDQLASFAMPLIWTEDSRERASEILELLVDPDGEGMSLEKLQQIQLELTCFGVKSEVSCEGNLTSMFLDLDAWRTLQELSLGMTDPEEAKEVLAGIAKGSKVYVTSVEDLQISEETFCVTEPYNNSVTFNGTVTGNCVEIGMYAKDVSVLNALLEAEGKDDPRITSGFQMCNLTEINGGKCTTPEAFYKACRAAAILGTFQAGYTDFKYLSRASQNITERESLLGVSITGWMNNPQVLFDKDILAKGVEVVRQTNKEVAALLGIPQAARLTCVKPSGNASVLLQTASGIHGEHAPRYIRNVQMNLNEDIAQTLMEEFPKMVEPSKWSATGKDVIVSFPIETPPHSRLKKDLQGVLQLDYVKQAQEFWVNAGTNHELCTRPWLRHNVSNTITVDDWDEVEQYIYDNRDYFAGISLSAEAGDKAYVQAPFTEVLTPEQMVEEYGEAGIFASGLVVDGKHAFKGDLFEACRRAQDFTTSSIEDEEFLVALSKEVEDPLQRDWIRRFHKFAFNFFGGHLQRTEFCLKDSHNLHTWIAISRDLHDVDFTSKLKSQVEVEVNTMGAQACAGGACEINF